MITISCFISIKFNLNGYFDVVDSQSNDTENISGWIHAVKEDVINFAMESSAIQLRSTSQNSGTIKMIFRSDSGATFEMIWTDKTTYKWKLNCFQEFLQLQNALPLKGAGRDDYWMFSKSHNKWHIFLNGVHIVEHSTVGCDFWSPNNGMKVLKFSKESLVEAYRRKPATQFSGN